MDSPFCFCCRLILIQVDFSCKVVGINRNNGATSIGAASSDTVVKLDKLLREIRENVTSCVNIQYQHKDSIPSVVLQPFFQRV